MPRISAGRVQIRLILASRSVYRRNRGRPRQAVPERIELCSDDDIYAENTEASLEVHGRLKCIMVIVAHWCCFPLCCSQSQALVFRALRNALRRTALHAQEKITIVIIIITIHHHHHHHPSSLAILAQVKCSGQKTSIINMFMTSIMKL